MPTFKDKNLRKLQNSGNRGHYTISLPVEMVRQLKWREHQKIVFELDKQRKRLIIKDWKK